MGGNTQNIDEPVQLYLRLLRGFHFPTSDPGPGEGIDARPALFDIKACESSEGHQTHIVSCFLLFASAENHLLHTFRTFSKSFL